MAEKKDKKQLKQQKQSAKKVDKKATKATGKKATKKAAKKPSSKEVISQLKKQVADLKKKNGSLDDQYLRAEAEMQNVQKHDAMDAQQIRKYSGQKLAKSILPGLDNMERALAVKTPDKGGKQLKQGVKMVYDRLTQALSENGIKEVKVAGKPFNPEYAQAVQTVPATKKHPADQVVKVLQKGYRLHDRTLRPAMVVVAK
ncbi:nucleotide exchange factor GrpE [Acetilactobacillus jinshanensis]|uniref:nucleotide exchange factor GrpE n=1 Tax=Acetilactobacillus jinshanensis TaxID=1720083 RepID=UPI003CE4C4F6